MLAGLLTRRWCKSPKAFVSDSLQKKSLVSIMIKVCWPCMTLHPLLSSMCYLGYKSPCWKKSYGPCSLSSVSPCRFFLVSFSFLLSLLFLQAKVIGTWGYIDFPRKPIIIRALILSTDAIPLNRQRRHPEGIPGSNRGWTPVVFTTFFNLSLNFAIRSSWSGPQSAPALVFADCIELLHLQLQKT